MSNKKTENMWELWEGKVKEFKNASKYPPPETTIRHWQRYLLFIFMQELSKNVIKKKESFDSIMERIIEAFQIGCGFKRIRIYIVIENDRDNYVLELYKISKDHGIVKVGRRLKTKYADDKAVNTFSSKEPLVVDYAEKLKLCDKDLLKPKGPYAAIPLFVEGKPYGLICADTVSPEISSKITHKVNNLEYKEHFDTFARTIMSAIENRIMFDQREQKIKQFEMVKELNELIESETDKEKLLESFIKHCVEKANADGGHLKLYDKSTKNMKRVAAYGEYATPRNLKQKPNDISFSYMALEKKVAILINDLTNQEIMKKNIKYCEERGLIEYLKRLKKRKSILIVPLIKHTREIYGVLDLYSKQKNHFTEIDKGNLMALANSVTYAVDKTMQLERRDMLLSIREKLHKMLQKAVEEAHDLKSVLEIITNCCFRLEIIKDIKKACLFIEDPQTTGKLKPPFFKCAEGQNCRLCLKENPIIQKAFNTRQMKDGNNDKALPICMKDKSIGVLYLQSKHKINLDKDEEELLNIITNTAAILITPAKNYEEKIKQINTFYSVGQLSTEIGDFKDWFNHVMEKVLDIIGKENRSFHLVIVEKGNDEKKLIVLATSPLFNEGKETPVKPELIGMELPLDNSLSGWVVKAKESKILLDIDKKIREKKCKEKNKIPFHDYDERIKSEVGIPLKIKEGDKEEVIGVLIIDSVIPEDFRDFDLKFHEILASYLAIAIQHQRLYKKLARYQEKIYQKDRSLALQAFMKSFLHDITAPIQEFRSKINIMKIDREPKWQEDLNYLDQLSEKLLSSYGEFVKDFTKPFSESSVMEIKEIITNSLETVEKTRGLGINIEGNYRDSDTMIECYHVFIEMAFRAIINNAIKYSRSMKLENRYLKIDINPNEDNNSGTISFESSTTEKIPADKQEQIFKPFVRLSNKEKGHGLGLGIAAECINLHDGKIWAENVEGRSAVRFHITLPKSLKISKEYQND